jgi:hypothetical protein
MDLYDGIDLSLVAIRNNVIADSVLINRLDKATNQYVMHPLTDTAAAEEFKKAGNVLVNGDPGFVDVNKRDFRFRKDSPALKAGFKPIPFAQIGLVADEYRPAKAMR